jgi:hypothetical protein
MPPLLPKYSLKTRKEGNNNRKKKRKHTPKSKLLPME